MRSSSAIAVVSLATAFSAFSASVIPATAAQAASRAASSDAVFSKVVVGGGKDVVLGPATKKTVTLTWRVTDPDGVAASWAYLWHGPNTDDADGILPTYTPAGACTVSPTDHTTADCKLSFVVDTARDLRRNALAGTWNVLGGAQDRADDWTEIDAVATARFKRAPKLTVNASPEPVRKGRTITVVGRLTRADWETHGYPGYRGQPVKLQFRKKGTTTYTTLKTVTSGTNGALRTTTKARTDGYFRFVFAGNTTTGPLTTAGDYVDVR